VSGTAKSTPGDVKCHENPRSKIGKLGGDKMLQKSPTKFQKFPGVIPREKKARAAGEGRRGERRGGGCVMAVGAMDSPVTRGETELASA